MTGIPIWRPEASSIRHVASDSKPLPASQRLSTTFDSGPWIRRNLKSASRPARARSASASGGQHEVAGTDGVLVRHGPPPVAAAARAADEQHAHAGLPKDPERLPLARVEHGIFVDHLPVRRNAQELAAARAAVVLHLGPETIGRGRPRKTEPRVAARRREFVEAIAEAPGRAAAERRQSGARASVIHASIHGRTHRGSVTSPAWILQGNRLRLRSSWTLEEAL